MRPYRLAETQVFDAIEENLPEEIEESEWNWSALAKWSNTRWSTNYRDRDLKKVGRDRRDRTTCSIKAATMRSARSICRKVLPISWTRNSVSKCMCLAARKIWYRAGRRRDDDKARFRIRVPSIGIHDQACEEAYDRRESEYPVLAGLYRFSVQVDRRGHKSRHFQRRRTDRSGLAERFGASDLTSTTCVKNKQRDEIHRAVAVGNCSREHQQLPGPIKWPRRSIDTAVESLFCRVPGPRPP